MCVYHNEDRWDASNVILRDGFIHRYSKKVRLPDMRFIDWGLGVMKAEGLSRWPEDRAWDLAEYYEQLSLKGRLAGYEMTQRFYEIGSLKD